MKFSKVCHENSWSKIDYARCRAGFFIDAINSIKNQTGFTCDDQRCIYKLKSDKDMFRWEGEGYKLTFYSGDEAEAILAPEREMNAIVIADPRGRLSVFSSCGTCLDIDYVRGPIKHAAVVRASETVRLLAVPR